MIYMNATIGCFGWPEINLHCCFSYEDELAYTPEALNFQITLSVFEYGTRISFQTIFNVTNHACRSTTLIIDFSMKTGKLSHFERMNVKTAL